MLRRVSQALRLLLLALGILLIAWTPFSWFNPPGMSHPLVELSLGNGALEMRFNPPWAEPGLSFGVGGLSSDRRYYSRGLWATYQVDRWGTMVSVPLWLLAAVFLAWPVSSFIAARRRRKGRGFEVRTEGERH